MGHPQAFKSQWVNSTVSSGSGIILIEKINIA